MIDTTARASVKKRLDIDAAVTPFDSAIDEFVLAGVSRLYPIAQLEVDRQEVAVTVDSYGEASVTLSGLTTPVLSARTVEAYYGAVWSPATETYHHGSQLIVSELPTGVTKLRIYGNTAFSLANVPSYLEQAVIWYAMSEFYSYLAGNKSKYNIYNQSNARSVDNMKDEADFYEQKANVYLNDRAQLYGIS